jgi:hypothetical protein
MMRTINGDASCAFTRNVSERRIDDACHAILSGEAQCPTRKTSLWKASIRAILCRACAGLALAADKFALSFGDSERRQHVNATFCRHLPKTTLMFMSVTFPGTPLNRLPAFSCGYSRPWETESAVRITSCDREACTTTRATQEVMRGLSIRTNGMICLLSATAK